MAARGGRPNVVLYPLFVVTCFCVLIDDIAVEWCVIASRVSFHLVVNAAHVILLMLLVNGTLLRDEAQPLARLGVHVAP